MNKMMLHANASDLAIAIDRARIGTGLTHADVNNAADVIYTWIGGDDDPRDLWKPDRIILLADAATKMISRAGAHYGGDVQRYLLGLPGPSNTSAKGHALDQIDQVIATCAKNHGIVLS